MTPRRRPMPLPTSARARRLAKRDRMLWLIDADVRIVGDSNRRYAAPWRLVNGTRRLDPLGTQLGERRIEIIAHEEQLVTRDPVLGRMNRDLCGRKREDQPAASGIDVIIAEDIAEKGARRLSVFGIDDRVNAVDHVCPREVCS